MELRWLRRALGLGGLRLRNEGLEAQWPAIRRVWLRSGGDVIRGPIGPGAVWTPDAELLGRICRRRGEAEALALRHLDDPHPWVAAHCLAILEQLASPFAAELPVELLARTEPIHLLFGWGVTVPLGEYARRVRDAARR